MDFNLIDTLVGKKPVAVSVCDGRKTLVRRFGSNGFGSVFSVLLSMHFVSVH